MKQLAAWATAFKHSYQNRVFLSTWVNIIVFHTFFVLVMAVVFYYTLDYVKVTIFTAITLLLTNAVNGTPIDPSLLNEAVHQVDQISLFVLIGAFLFAVLTSVAAAYITLKPTRRALAMQKRFISSVAHELRTPLSVLRTNNEVALYDLEANAPIRETIQSTITETIHLTNVLNNLLLFSRVDTAETLPFTTVDINVLVETVARKLQPLAHHKKVLLTTSYTPNNNAVGNQTAIEQALYNIVKNAITYSKPHDAKIQITTMNHGGVTSVQVTDNGIGISKKDLPNIFSPFFRANEARGNTDSMGLGLALVFEVMKLHRGNISVQSNLNTGTTIKLSFRRPRELPSAATPTSSRTDTIEYDFGKR